MMFRFVFLILWLSVSFAEYIAIDELRMIVDKGRILGVVVGEDGLLIVFAEEKGVTYDLDKNQIDRIYQDLKKQLIK